MSEDKINHLRWSDPAAWAEAGREVDVYAHRGSMLLAPENTELAFERALAFGADVLEIDVRLSIDGHVIVTHDAQVDRTCGGSGTVAQMTLQTLKTLDAGWHFHDLQGEPYRGKGIGLMTLDEMFERFPTTRINIDIKDTHKEAALAVAKSIVDADAHQRVNVGSFNANALAYFRETLPSVTTAATQSEVARLYFTRSMVKSATYSYLQIPQVYHGLPLATPSFLTCAKRLNINVVYWTINDVVTMKKLVAKGVDGLVTDRVDLACELLGKSARASA